MSDFTPEQVERAAEALWFGAGGGSLYGWGNLSGASRQAYLLYAEKILSAAGAPERTPEFESREQELFKHQPVLSMSDGGVVGCQCMDRVFYRKTEDWGTHLAEVFDLLSAAGAPEKVAPVVDEAALAKVIAPHKMIWAAVSRDAAYCQCGEKYPRNGQPHMEWFELHRAAAVAAYLRGESK